jgi:hypothetical protein
MTKHRSTTNKRSGGIDVNAETVNTEDVVGRDKNVVSGDSVKGDKINAGGDAFTGDNATKINTNVGTIIKDSDVHIEAPAPIATSLHQLPSPPIDFTGRTAELAELLSNIEHGAIITGLRGMGGIGKTALALVLADQLKAVKSYTSQTPVRHAA